MSRWPMFSLGTAIELAYGKSLPKSSRFEGGSIPVYGSNGVAGWHNEALLDGPTVIVGRKGSAGAVQFVDGPCYPIDTTYFVRPRQGFDFDTKFLFYLLRHLNLSRLKTATGVPGLTREDAYKEIIPVPPLAEQRRIVDILSRAEGIVRLRRDAEKKAAELIPALFLDMFGDPATNPKGWRQSTLDESGAAIRYGIGQPLPQIEGGLPFLRATNVKRGVISRTGLVYIDQNANPMKRNPPLKHTDILVVRSGAYTGDIAQVGREFDGAIAGYDLVLSPGSKHLSEFLATYLLLPHVQNGYMAAHKIRAAQPHLNSTQLGNIIVPIPPLNIQSKFVESVNSVRSIQSQQSAATATAQATFDALLAKVFSASPTNNLTSNT